MKELSLKEKRFVEEYIIDFNGSRAARDSGYNIKRLAETAYNVLKRDHVIDAVQKEVAIRSERTKVTQDKVVKELAKIAFSNIKDYMSWDDGVVSLKDSKEIDRVDAAVIAEIKKQVSKHGENFTFKLYSKEKALELLGKHLGMFIDKTEDVTKGHDEWVKLMLESEKEKGEDELYFLK